MKSLVAFDLDGTLAESKQPLEPVMADAIAALLGVAQVAVISGGDWPQFEKQVVGRLPAGADVNRLWIMPTTGAKLYRPDSAGQWAPVYADNFSDEEKARILGALQQARIDNGLDKEQVWGEQIEDRGTQLTFSGLGQEAPLDAKKAWDPDFAKRKGMQASVSPKLPEFSVNVGGSTSIDITRKGVDKAWGLKRLAEESGIPLGAMLFVGDAIYPGGNDYPPRAAGMDTIQVRDPAETLTMISTLTAWLAAD